MLWRSRLYSSSRKFGWMANFSRYDGPSWQRPPQFFCPSWNSPACSGSSSAWWRACQHRQGCKRGFGGKSGGGTSYYSYHKGWWWQGQVFFSLHYRLRNSTTSVNVTHAAFFRRDLSQQDLLSSFGICDIMSYINLFSFFLLFSMLGSLHYESQTPRIS